MVSVPSQLKEIMRFSEKKLFCLKFSRPWNMVPFFMSCP